MYDISFPHAPVMLRSLYLTTVILLSCICTPCGCADFVHFTINFCTLLFILHIDSALMLVAQYPLVGHLHSFLNNRCPRSSPPWWMVI